jgi:succinyl-diaminopimelate desuccinylase
MTATKENVSGAPIDRLVSLTRDLILIPSFANRPQDIERCVEFVHNHLDTLVGIRIETLECDGHPSIVAVPENIDEPTILLCAHLDVIEHGEVSSYKSTIENGRIIGPGAGDMKGQLAILLEVFAHFCNRHPGVSLGIAITSDEESGGMAGVRYLFEDKKMRCGEVLLPDGGAPNSIVVEEKGILHLNAHAQGTASHAAYPWLGENPLEHLQHALRSIHEHFETLKRADDVEHWYPTCSVTGMRTENSTTNRIPAWAEARLDIRFTPPISAEQMLESVRKVVNDTVTLSVVLAAEPSHLQPSTLFSEITEEVTHEPAELTRACGGSDARFICHYGIPVIVSRPRVGDLHAESEWIEIASMEAYYLILKRYIERRLLETESA